MKTMPDMEKVIRIIDELIFEAQKAPTWKAENALRCVKKELLKEQEAVVRCKDCKFGHWWSSEQVIVCDKLATTKEASWFCADGERK